MEREHCVVNTVIPHGWERAESFHDLETGVVTQKGWTTGEDYTRHDRVVDVSPGIWRGQIDSWAYYTGEAFYRGEQFTLKTEPQDFVNQTMKIVYLPSCDATIGFEVDTFSRLADFPKISFLYRMGKLASTSIDVGPNTRGQIPPADIDSDEFDKISEQSELRVLEDQRSYGVNFYFIPTGHVRYEMTHDPLRLPTGLRYYEKEFKEGVMQMVEEFRYEDVAVTVSNEEDDVLLVCRRKRGELADAMTKVRVPKSIDIEELTRFVSDPRSNRWERLLGMVSAASFDQVEP